MVTLPNPHLSQDTRATTLTSEPLSPNLQAMLDAIRKFLIEREQEKLEAQKS